MNSKIKNIALLITLILAISLSKSAVADTPTYELNSSAGIWTSVDGGGDTVTGVGTVEIRWGEPTQDERKSGLRFDGAGLQSFNESEVFLLGQLTHMNWPIYAPAATGATLQITLEFNNPAISPNPQFSYAFEIEETPNEDYQWQCQDWHTPGNPPCDDRITFPNEYGQESFKIGDKLYTLQIVGFIDVYPGGTLVQKFITREQADNVAYLVGTLSSVLVAEPDITITKKTNGVDVESAPGLYLYEGDTVTWDYIVQNTGNVSLSGIAVTDDQEGMVTCPEDSLEPGELMTCSSISNVVVSGQYTNTATASGNPSSGDPVSKSDTSYYYGINPGLSLDKSADHSTFSAVNETITYTFTVENTGDATLTDVVINDPLTGSVNLPVSPSTLAPGEIGTATATYVTQQSDLDAGVIINTATASAKDPNDNLVEDQDDETVNGPQSGAEIEVVKEVAAINGDPGTTQYSQAGDIITYNFTVTNTGLFTLSNITLTDPDASVSGGPIASLLPGISDSTTFTATYTITQDDINNGSFTNTATVTGNPPFGDPVTDSDSETVSGPDPAPFIHIVKSIADINGNPSITEYSQVGDIITYSFTVTNTGNVTLTNVTVTDPEASVSGGPIASLAPGASDSTTFTATYTITQDDIDHGSFLNKATVTGQPPAGDPVTDTDTETVPGPDPNPSINVLKEVVAINGNPAITEYSQVGDIISYNFTVTNTGNVTLSNVTITDPEASVSGGPIASLAPAASDSTTFTATYTVSQDDIDNGSFINTATAYGTPPVGDPVTDSDSETVSGPDLSASIEVVKVVSAINGNPSITEYSQVSDVISYSFTVTNTGNVTLSNVRLTDPDASISGGPIASLAPGASDSTTFTASYTITQSDMDAGSFTNTATATASPPSGSDVTDDDSATVEGPKTGASIHLSKQVVAVNDNPAITEFSQIGDVVSYSFTITNTGIFTLTNVTLTDPDASVSGGPIASLAPGVSDSSTFTATYSITQDDIDNGSFTNIATVTGNQPFGAPVTDDDDASIQGPDSAPAIQVIKSIAAINDNPAVTEYSQVGDIISYAFTVTNTGNVTLSNVTLTDPDASVSGSPIASLAPGASDSSTFTATYTITQADIDRGHFTNIATASGQPPVGDPVTDLDSATVYGPDSNPSIEVVKSVASVNGNAGVTEYTQVGDIVAYSFTVTNTGNVTLSNVRVTDPDASVSGGPIASLAPGASDSATFTATYTITQADIDNGSFTNTATATATPPSGSDVTDDDNATVEGPKTGASILLVKQVTAVNGEVSLTEYSQVGDIISYSFTVTNTGIFTLTNVTLTDPDVSVSGGPIPSLAPGASDSTTFTATYTITQDDIDNGSFTNTATVTGNQPFGSPVSDDDSASIQGPAHDPSIEVLKTVSAINGNPAITDYSQVGDVISYAFTVTNTGNVTLSNVTVTDPKTSISGGPIASLAPSASDSTTFTATYTIKQSDIDNGSFTNTATASGTPPVGDPVTDSDSATVSGPAPAPSVEVIKSVSAINGNPGTTEYSEVGDVISYAFTITNTGNVTLSNIRLTDPDASVSGGPIPSLAPGASDSTTFTATYTITQADIDNGAFTNTATVTATPPSGSDVTDDDSATVEGPKTGGSIELIKEVAAVNDDPSEAVFSQVGDVISYKFTVRNTGIFTLTNVTLSDPDTSVSGGPIPSLAPGASDSTTFTATYVITQNDMDTSYFTNTATVSGNPPFGTPVTDDDSATVDGPTTGASINLVKTVAAINGNPSITEYSQVGDVITYQFSITNNGTLTLYNVTLTDPDTSVSGGPITSLAPGANDNTTFTATYTITQADIDNGSFTNTATATASPPFGDDVSDDDSATVEGPKTGGSIELLKEIADINGNPAVTEYSQVGDIISYNFTVTNTGIFTLTNVTLTDPDVSVSGGPIASLAPGASDSTTFTATYQVTQADIDAGVFTNTATVTGHPPFGAPVTDNDSATAEGPKTGASIELLKEVAAVNGNPAITEYSLVGDVISYNFTVTNTGIFTLTNVTLTDPDTSVSGGPIPSLAPGASDSTTFTATFTITQADIDNGSFMNTATVSGNPPFGSPVTDTDSATISGPAADPAIELLKEVAAVNGNPSVAVYSQVGDVITYNFTVTNTGNVTLSNVTVTDPDTSVSGSTIFSLAPGASDSTTFTATYTITQDDINAASFTNTATATGSPPSGTDVSDDDSATIEGPKTGAAIELVKDVAAVNGNPAITEYSQVDDIVSYSFTVTNTGIFTLTNVTLTDPDVSVSGGPIPSLAPGASDSTTFTATYTITQADIDNGSFMNTATVSGNPPFGSPVTDSDSATISGPAAGPAIELLKEVAAVNGDPSTAVYSQVGDVVTYSFTVTNSGNVTLSNVTLSDPDVTVSGGPISSLAPGAGDSTTFSATYTITQDDINAGAFTNTATVTGSPPSGAPVHDNDSASIEGPKTGAAIELIKEVAAVNGNPAITEYSQVGDIVSYSFTVTNTGIFTLTNVTLSDPDVSVSGGPIPSLAPGASDSTTFTGTYTITQDDIDTSSFINTAMVSGQPPFGDPVYDFDSANIPGPASAPSIHLVKDVAAINSSPSITEYNQVGDVISYDFTVTNNGNVTLTNVTLTDPDVTVSGDPIASLAPGASDSTTFTATYNITQDDIDAGLFNNTATVSGQPPSGAPVTDDDSATVEGPKSGAAIELIKEVSAINGDPSITEYKQAGDIISYRFTVTNTGPFTLINVTLTDPDATVSGGPIASLAPGASDSTTFTATYTITSDDMNNLFFTNTATVSGQPPSGSPVTDDDSATVIGLEPPTPTPTFTATPTNTPTTTDTPTPTPTEEEKEDTATPTPTNTVTDTPTPTDTPEEKEDTPTPTSTEKEQDTPTPTYTSTIDNTPDVPPGGDELFFTSFLDAILNWLCSIGFSFSQCK